MWFFTYLFSWNRSKTVFEKILSLTVVLRLLLRRDEKACPWSGILIKLLQWQKELGFLSPALLIIRCVCAQLLSCVRLCEPMNCSPPGFSVQGILQASILEQVAISSSMRYSWPRDQTHISCVYCISRWILLPLSHLGSPVHMDLPLISNDISTQIRVR